MVDFSKISENIRIKNAMQGPKYPYAEDDAQYFRRCDIRTGSVEVTAEFRHNAIGEIIAVAFTDQGERIDLVFVGRRADDFKAGLGAVLEDMHQTAILGDDFSDARTFRVTAKVSGFWSPPVRWQDNEGQWRSRQQLIVSEWEYGVLSRGVEHRHTEGRAPLSA